MKSEVKFKVRSLNFAQSVGKLTSDFIRGKKMCCHMQLRVQQQQRPQQQQQITNVHTITGMRSYSGGANNPQQMQMQAQRQMQMQQQQQQQQQQRTQSARAGNHPQMFGAAGMTGVAGAQRPMMNPTMNRQMQMAMNMQSMPSGGMQNMQQRGNMNPNMNTANAMQMQRNMNAVGGMNPNMNPNMRLPQQQNMQQNMHRLNHMNPNMNPNMIPNMNNRNAMQLQNGRMNGMNAMNMNPSGTMMNNMNRNMAVIGNNQQQQNPNPNHQMHIQQMQANQAMRSMPNMASNMASNPHAIQFSRSDSSHNSNNNAAMRFQGMVKQSAPNTISFSSTSTATTTSSTASASGASGSLPKWNGCVLWKIGPNQTKTQSMLSEMETVVPYSSIEQQKTNESFLQSLAYKVKQNEIDLGQMIIVIWLSNYAEDHALIRQLRQIVHTQEILLYNYKSKISTEWTSHYTNLTVVNKKARLIECIKNSYLFYLHHASQ